jgi:hypothetical protein
MYHGMYNKQKYTESVNLCAGAGDFIICIQLYVIKITKLAINTKIYE